MTRPIFLYTGCCTGTIYAQRLLETHCDVDACILENLRVDLDGEAGYLLAMPIHKTGAGLPPGETYFSELNTAWLRGELPTARLLHYYAHWKHETRVDAPVGTPYKIVRAGSERAARDLFGVPAPVDQQSCRLFFHDHLRFAHLAGDYGPLADVDVVTTIRHPLLTAISLLRRASELSLWEFWTAFPQLVYGLEVIYFPIDIGRNVDAVRRKLGLPDDANFAKAAAVDVVVNQTAGSARAERYESPQRNADPELLTARRMLIEENRLHPRLRGYWSYLRRQNWLRLYESFGYDFRGF